MLGHFHIMQLTCNLYAFTTRGCFNVLLISVWLRVRHRQPGRLHLRPDLRPLRHQDRPENFVQQRGLPPGHLRPLLRLLGLHRKCQLVHRVVLPAQVRKFGGHCWGGGWSITPLLALELVQAIIIVPYVQHNVNPLLRSAWSRNVFRSPVHRKAEKL